jgi:glycosyltransferase involved in cell wall biosynthesis
MKCIMHIPWKMIDESVSATEVRPRKMKKAFEDIGYNVFFITGSASERNKQIKELERSLESGEKYDFLYSESSTLPMQLTESHHLPTHPFTDKSLFALAKKNRIPIGLFYRDYYWVFPEIHRFNKIKTLYTKLFHIIELQIYNRFLDVIYFSTDLYDMTLEKLRYLDKDLKFYTLPSGADLSYPQPEKKENYFAFIGDIGPNRHNIKVLMQTFNLFPQYELRICTPQKCWNINKQYYEPYLTPNIKILHLVNEEAQEFLSKAKYAFCYFSESNYRKYTLAYKFFDYVGHNLPIICNENDYSGQLIKKLGIGYSIKHSVKALSEWLNNIPSEAEYTLIIDNIEKVKKENSWLKRAETVRNTLISFNKGYK